MSACLNILIYLRILVNILKMSILIYMVCGKCKMRHCWMMQCYIWESAQSRCNFFYSHLSVSIPVIRLHFLILLNLHSDPVMASGSELKEMIKGAIREIQEEEKAKGEASQLLENDSKSKTSTRAGKQPKTLFDESRTMNPTNPGDPRVKETTWPCFGAHVMKAGNNRWGRWTECIYCALRTEYAPAIGAPATTCKHDHAQNVIQAIEQDLEPNTFKQAMKMVAAQHVLAGPKMKAAVASSKAKMDKKKKAAIDGVEQLEAPSDDSFELTETAEKDGKKDPKK